MINNAKTSYRGIEFRQIAAEDLDYEDKFDIGYPDWRRYKYRKEGWDGKSYICTRCESKERQRLPDSRNNAIKAIANSRNSLLDIDSNTAKGLIGEAIIAKVRDLEVISIKLDNFRTRFDLSLDSEYDIIQSKLRSP